MGAIGYDINAAGTKARLADMTDINNAYVTD